MPRISRMKKVLFLLIISLSSPVIAKEKKAPKTSEEKNAISAPDATKPDFGAKMLARLIESGFSREQKSKAIEILKGHRPAIKKICARLVTVIDAEEKKAVPAGKFGEKLAQIEDDLKATNTEIERDLLKIASNEQIVQLKLRMMKDQKKELAKTPDVDTE